MKPLTCFKAYDIRGRLGIDLDENIAYGIGAAFAVALEAKTVILGRDVRASSEELAKSVAHGLIDQGCEVLELGLSGTEQMYSRPRISMPMGGSASPHLTTRWITTA